MYLFGLDLCQYSNIFGQAYQGFHKIRIPGMDLAAFDVIFTLILAYSISRYGKINLFTVSLVLFTLAFFIHWALCVPTAFNVMVLGDNYNSSKDLHFPF